MKTMFFRRCLLLGGLCLLTSMVFADTIKLKNGSVIKGKVTVYTDREFTVLLDLGSASKRSSSRMVISVEDVESIQFDTDEMASGVTAPATENGERYTPPPTKERPVQPVTQPVTQPAFSNAPAPAKPPTATGAGDVSAADKTILVAAAADWTSTEIKVRKGQRVSISATGQVDLGNNHAAGPNGIGLGDPKRLLLASPTGALIAVIGDDNDDFIPVGNQADFVAARDGVLFLSVNEGNLKDNNGSFTAKVKVR